MKSSHLLLCGLLLSTLSFADTATKSTKAKDLNKEASITLSNFKIPAGEYEIYLIDGKVYGMEEGMAKVYKNLGGSTPFKFCALQTHCKKSDEICGLKNERVVSKEIKPSTVTYENANVQQVTFKFPSDEPDFGIMTCTSNKSSPDLTLGDIESQLGPSIKIAPKNDQATKDEKPKAEEKPATPTKKPQAKNKVELIELNDKNIQSETANGLFVVEVSQEGCEPCMKLKAVLVKLAQKYEGCIRFGIYTIGEIDGSVPWVTFYRNGVKSGGFSGYKEESEVDSEIGKQLLTPEDALKCVNKVGQPSNGAPKQDDQKPVKSVEMPWVKKDSNEKKKQEADPVK